MSNDSSPPDPVPELLRGAWRRTSMVSADGGVDDTSTVVWLQLPSSMVDVRFSAAQSELASRGSLEACSFDDLRTLGTSESSSGFTTCTAIESDDEGQRRAMAEWFTRGHGIAFQPVSAYPEPGQLEWNSDGNVMIERAPSGAYVEEWNRIPDTSGPLTHSNLPDGRQIYRTGSVAVLVRDRTAPIPNPARLALLIDEAGTDRGAITALLDCEVSLAELQGDDFLITASTLPWRTGDVLDVRL